MVGKIPFDTAAHNALILQRLDKMRETKDHCDFVIKVGSEEIAAHRNILSAGSDYFAAMLSHDTKEKQTGIAEIKEADPSCVKKCIDLIYTGMPPDVDDNIEQLMHTAHLLQLTSLCKGIVDLLGKDLDFKTIFLTMKLANLYNYTQLVETCDRFILENLEQVSKLVEFGHLDRSYIEVIIKSENMAICGENKLDALLHWLKCDLENRNIFLGEILNHISLVDLSVGYLRQLIQNERLINKNNKLLKEFSLAAFDNMDVKPESQTNCKITDNVLIFDRISRHIQCFNPINNKWIQLHEIDDAMTPFRFSAVCVGNYIYVLTEDQSVYKLYYLEKTATWDYIGHTIDEHGLCPPAVSLQNCIYIFGGHDKCSTKSVEKYNTISNKWNKLDHKPKASQYSEIIVLNEKVYSCGGMVDEDYTNVVECFDPVSLTWTTKAPMKEAKGFIACVAIYNKIYAFGGFDGEYLRTVECYNPAADTWSLLKQMNTARARFRSFKINGYIYAVGGCNDPNSIEKYDIEKNEWEDVELSESMNIKIMESVSVKMKLQ